MKLYFLIIPLITVLVAGIGSIITLRNLHWYNQLSLPSFTPPGWVISAVWTAIFILTTISIFIFWNSISHNTIFQIVIAMFLINGLLNIGWTYIFFSQHIIYLAVWEAGVLGLSTLILAILIWPFSQVASILLWPYVVWTFFATFLTFSTWRLN